MSSCQVSFMRKQQRNKDFEEEEDYNAADFYSNFYHDEQEDDETPPNIGFGLAPTAEEVNVITSNQKFSLKNLFKYRIKKSGSYIKSRYTSVVSTCWFNYLFCRSIHGFYCIKFKLVSILF